MTPHSVDPTQPTPTDLLVQLATLQGKFANMAAIEQAKGALMFLYGLTADASFDLPQLHSRNQNVSVSTVALQLTSLLSAGAETITQFDRLIDTGDWPATRDPVPEGRTPSPMVEMTGFPARIDTDQTP